MMSRELLHGKPIAMALEELVGPSCHPPFVSQASYPPKGGDLAGRLCANLTQGFSTVSCCLPCPITDWVYSDAFSQHAQAANYLAIVLLILDTFLLLSFAALKKEHSYRHYLSTGLTVSFMLIAIAFIAPLGSHHEYCYDDITPNDFQTDSTCAFTGIFVMLGGMGVVVWILLRSIWMALRLMADFKKPELFRTISLGLGIGLPILFLAISLPINGVSYRLGNVCFPNKPGATLTWFAWLLIFAGISWIIQVITILYCLWKFASKSFAGPGHSSTPSESSNAPPVDPSDKADIARSQGRKKRIAWRRVRSILALQWRTIALSFIIVNLTIFFGMAFIDQTSAVMAAKRQRMGFPLNDSRFANCLIVNKGDKTPCLSGSTGLGLVEPRAVATLVLAPSIGILVSLLLIRKKMFIGWWSLIQNPREAFRRSSVQNHEAIEAASKEKSSHIRNASEMSTT